MNAHISRKVGVWILGAALLGVVAFIGVPFLRTTSTMTVETPARNIFAAEVVRAVAAKDGDGDGLHDWEETLWKTDSENPDSDNDGTPDGEEVAGGRNPALAGPNDVFDFPRTDSEMVLPSREPVTLSDRLGAQMFTEYLRLKQSGAPIDEHAIQALINPVIATAEEALSPDIFTVSDFRTTEDSPETVRAYGNQMGTAILIHSPKNFENELVILERAVSLERFDELEKLDPIIDGYVNAINDMAHIPVPKNALGTHTRFLNSLAFLRDIASRIRSFETDPLQTLTAVQAYIGATESFLEVVDETRRYFIEQKISFGPDDPVNVFLAI